jgi:hypothetical protein
MRPPNGIRHQHLYERLCACCQARDAIFLNAQKYSFMSIFINPFAINDAGENIWKPIGASSYFTEVKTWLMYNE